MLLVASLSLDLSQSLIIKAEVMRYFVAHHFPYFCLDLIAGATLCLYRPLEYADLVGQDQPIPSPSSGLRHALVQSKQLPAIPCPRLPQLSPCGPLFYHDIDIFELALEFRRQTFDCSAYQTHKLLSVHLKRTQIPSAGVRRTTPMLAPNHVARQTGDVQQYHQKQDFAST